MKKTIIAILCAMFVCALVSLTACSKGDVGPQGPKGDKGDAGENGIGIVTVEKTASENNIDVYKIKYSNGTESFFTVTNGKDGANGTNGADGKDGKDGVGITDVTVNSSGEAVLTMSNGTSLNIGKIVGTNGKDGSNGINGKDGVGIETVALDESGNLSVKLTSGTVLNLGNVKGADGKDGANGTDGKDGVSVTKSEINEDGELVLTYSNGQSTNLGKVFGSDGKDGANGTNGTDGVNGANGKDGKDGVGIETVTLDEGGNLSVKLTSGTILNLGNVKGADGKDGANGTNGTDGKDGVSVTKSEINEDGELVLTYSNGQSTNLGKVVGSDGKDGTNGTNGTDGANGKDGKDGVGIETVTIDEDGNLSVTYTNGETAELGNIKGPKGDDGLSAFEIYKKYHPEYTGTEQEWLETLKGDKGDTGAAGVDGTNGKDGTSVTDAYVDESLHLWIVLSDGTKIDAGYVGVETTNPEPEPEPEITNPTIIVSSVTARAGETVDVTIALKNNPGITSMLINITFEDENIALTNMTYNTSIGGQNVPPQYMTSPVKAYWTDGFRDVTGDWTLVTLTFSVANTAAVGDYSINITYNPDDVYNAAEDNVNFDIINGIITVS